MPLRETIADAKIAIYQTNLRAKLKILLKMITMGRHGLL